MPAGSIADIAFGAGRQIGRYFGLVSAVPSALFVLFIYVLVKSGAWTSAPDWGAGTSALTGIGFGEASLLAVTSLAFGLALHPLQFALIQLLEGYWGTSRLGRGLAVDRVRRHRERADRLRDQRDELSGAIEKIGRDTLDGEPGEPWIPAIIAEQEFSRALDSYPPNARRVMPTRLGNVLRHYEDLAGTQYGLDAITIAPHLSLVAAPERVAYLRDAREQLDLAVRICTLSLLAAACTFMFLVDDGWSLLLAALPYGVGYVAYRGAIVAAHEYGTALATLIDLDRFRLYEHLHLAMPPDTATEQQANREVVQLIRFRTDHSIPYTHATAPPRSGARAVARYQPRRAPRMVLTYLHGLDDGEAWIRDLPGFKSDAQMERTLKPLRERWKLVKGGSSLQKLGALPGGEGWEAVALTPRGETVADGINAGKRSFIL